MNRRRALANIEVASDTNLSSALEFLSKGDDQEARGTHAKEVAGTVEPPEAYKPAFEAREQRLRALPGTRLSGTRLWTMRCTGRFVVGLGDASVRETGLRLLRPWGLPYIPGSALKGVAAKAAHARGGDWAAPAQPGDKAGVHHRALFGDVEAAGKVVFHDAWWIPSGSDLPVVPDVMTPHHKIYYGGKGAPLDSDSPTPVSFLTAHGEYLLALTGPRGWVDLALELLREALELDGVGGKTAAGHGRFEVLSERLSAEDLRRNELRRSLKDLPARDTGAGTHSATADELLAARALLGDDEVLAFARKVMENNRSSWENWLKGDRTEEERWLGKALQPQAPQPRPEAAAAPTPTPERWAVGEAWRKLVKKKPRVHFEGHLEDDPSAAVTDTRRPKDIQGSDILGDEPTPVRARVERRGDKWRVVEVVLQ